MEMDGCIKRRDKAFLDHSHFVLNVQICKKKNKEQLFYEFKYMGGMTMPQ